MARVALGSRTRAACRPAPPGASDPPRSRSGGLDRRLGVRRNSPTDERLGSARASANAMANQRRSRDRGRELPLRLGPRGDNLASATSPYPDARRVRSRARAYRGIGGWPGWYHPLRWRRARRRSAAETQRCGWWLRGYGSPDGWHWGCDSPVASRPPSCRGMGRSRAPRPRSQRAACRCRSGRGIRSCLRIRADDGQPRCCGRAVARARPRGCVRRAHGDPALGRAWPPGGVGDHLRRSAPSESGEARATRRSGSTCGPFSRGASVA